MFVVDQVTKNFDENWILKGVNFSMAEGEMLGLVGPSGGGKSVLLKILGKVLEPSTGNILWEQPGSSQPQTSEDDNQTTVGFLFQEGALFDSMSVLENVAFPLEHLPSPSRPGREERNHRAYEILEEVGLGKAYKKHPGQLSGGMRRRVALARALVARPELVLLDDPTGGLDPVAASVIMDLISDLHAKYTPTVVIVSHDIRRLLPRVKRVLSLFDGLIASDTAPKEIPDKAPESVTHFLATRFDFSDPKAFEL